MTAVRNFALLRRLRDLLQSEDTAQFPSNLNTDQIVATVDLSQIGGLPEAPAAPYQAYDDDAYAESQGGAGVDEINMMILPLDATRDRRIINLDIQLGGDIAAGIYQIALDISIYKDNVGTGYRVCYLWPWAFTKTSAAWTHVFALHGAVLRNTSTNIVATFASTWPGFLPAGYSMWASAFIVESAGAVFPASTNMTTRVNWIGVPKGRPLPGA